jgi:hypothetical protein
MIELDRQELPARPVRNRRLAPLCAGLSASVHATARSCARNVLGPPWMKPYVQGTGSNCAEARTDIADTSG